MNSFLPGQYVDRFSTFGSVYPLLPWPSNAVLRSDPDRLAANARARFAVHGDKIPPPEQCTDALRAAYRHYNCPRRKQDYPRMNAVQWALKELVAFLSAHASGRPNQSAFRIEAIPQYAEKYQCRFTTSNAENAESLSETSSSLETNSDSAPPANPLTVSAPTIGDAPELELLGNESQLREELLQRAKSSRAGEVL